MRNKPIARAVVYPDGYMRWGWAAVDYQTTGQYPTAQAAAQAAEEAGYSPHIYHQTGSARHALAELRSQDGEEF